MRKFFTAIVVLAALAGAVFAYRAYLISELRKPVLAQLSDPESAQFRNERVIGNWRFAGTVLCGDVNAKNKMGGYAGFSPFEAGVNGASVGKDGDILPPCDFEKDLRATAPWWWMTW